MMFNNKNYKGTKYDSTMEQTIYTLPAGRHYMTFQARSQSKCVWVCVCVYVCVCIFVHTKMDLQWLTIIICIYE